MAVLLYKSETQKMTTKLDCQNMIFLMPPASFFRTKIVGGWGFAPDPAEGPQLPHDVPPTTIPSTAGEEASHSLDPSILSAYGTSILASDMCPSKQNRGYDTEWVVMGERQFLSLPMAAKLLYPPLIKL
jgi:hypothetical protein